MVAEIPPSPLTSAVNTTTTQQNESSLGVPDVVESIAESGNGSNTVAVSVPPTPDSDVRALQARSPLLTTMLEPPSTTDVSHSPTTRNHRGVPIETDDEEQPAVAAVEEANPNGSGDDAVPPTPTGVITTAVNTGSDIVPTEHAYRGRNNVARVTHNAAPTQRSAVAAVIPTSPISMMHPSAAGGTPANAFVHPSIGTRTTTSHHQQSILLNASTSPLSTPISSYTSNPVNYRCINPASDINARLDTQVEVRVYPCNTSAGQKKKFTSFTIKPEGVIIQGSTRGNTNQRNSGIDLGTEYATQIGRKLCRYELADTRACQLLVTTHGKNFWVVPAPEAFSRNSGTCRLLGDRKHPPAPHTMQVGDFLRVGSVGVVVIETHDGVTNCVLSEEKIQRIMKDTTATGGFLDLAETDGENSDDSMDGQETTHRSTGDASNHGSTDHPVCYMCFDEEDTAENPMITPCKCSGDTKYVHVECLRKWHTAEADNQICFLSSVDATCSVCKSTFKSDFKLSDGRQVKLFKSSLEPPYVSLLVATKHEMAQRLFNTRFQLSFSTLMKPDGKNATRPLLLGRSSGSDMVLDYRTVSARHAAIRFKNGEFVFTDAGSSNGSYLYLRRPLELSPSQAVQFRLGRSMISMKVVNKWNRRLLRAVRGQRSATAAIEDETDGAGDDRSIGSVDGDIRITANHTVEAVQRRTRDSVMASLPAPGLLSQSSAKHLDFLFALAYPKREVKNKMDRTASSHSATTSPVNNLVAVPSTSPIAGSAVPLSSPQVAGTANNTSSDDQVLLDEPTLESTVLPQVQTTL